MNIKKLLLQSTSQDNIQMDNFSAISKRKAADKKRLGLNE